VTDKATDGVWTKGFDLMFGEPPSALFSKDGKYRWLLKWPTGRQNQRIMAFCGANPSKAGNIVDHRMVSDPTISRMRTLAQDLGYGWLWAVNARSYVSTDPEGVPPDPEGIGEATDAYIDLAARSCDLFLCAFGHLAGARAPRVIEIVRAAGKVPHAISFTSDGTPRHPRGVPSSARPVPIPEKYRG